MRPLRAGAALVRLALLIFAGLLLTASVAHAGVVWRDDFDSLSSDWVKRTNCPAEKSASNWLCYSPDNVWVSSGKLHMRQTPNDGTHCCGYNRPFLGSMVSTYKHGWGWPARDVRQAWKPPFKVTARVKWSGVDGFWQVFEAWTVDSAKPHEFDIAEMRGAAEEFQFCAMHNDVNVHLGTSLPFNITSRFRRYWMFIGTSAVTFGVGQRVCGTVAIPSLGRVGIAFTAKSADPDRFPWPGMGGPVLSPATYAVDWVQVSVP